MKYDLRDLMDAYKALAAREFDADDRAQLALASMLQHEDLIDLANEVRKWRPEGATTPERPGGAYMQESKKSRRTKITKRQIRKVLREALKQR